MVVLAVATIGLFGAGAPAHGAMDHPDDWVVWADNQNQIVLNDFTNAAVSACTMAELNDDRATADSQLEAVWSYADQKIAFLVFEDPGLAAAADLALEDLEEDHNDAHDEVAATYALVADAMVPCATTTTTTTTPGTTTTTTSSPTTTSSTSTTVPRSTTSSTTSTSTTTTTTMEPTTTTTTRPLAAVFVDEPPGDRGGTAVGSDVPVSTPPGATATDPVIDMDDAMTSALVFDADGIAINDGMGSSVAEGMAHTGMISGMFTAGASVLLPPGLVQKAVGPIIAMEFLVRTLIESLGTMIVPLTVFLMAAGFVIWRESRRSAPIAG